MEEHMKECFTYGGTKVNIPEKGGNTFEFTQYYKQQTVPFCTDGESGYIRIQDSLQFLNCS